MNAPKFGAWSVAESPIRVEYSTVVIEEIRHAVAEGFQRLSRGGIEVGGVLYGIHDGRTVRITATRPIDCEHARGPAFLLSDKDKSALNQQFARDQRDPRLEGLIAVGWYLSHTRSEIALNESDLEIYSTFFPAPWQITMVVHPGRGGAMRAGFFVRNADGTLKSERSYLEFDFPDRLPGALERAARHDRAPAERRPGGLPHREPAPMAPPRHDIPPRQYRPAPAPEFLAAPARRRKWPWLVLWAAAVGGLAFLGVRYAMFQPVSEPISLSVVEREGQLEIDWNHASKSVTGASRGLLEIIDGPDTVRLPLSPQHLAGDKITYARKSGDVEVRMSIEDAGGHKMQEATRFLGRPPAAAAAANSDELVAIQRKRDELEAELRRLRQQNGDRAARIQQLERTLRILQTRIGIDQGKQ